MAYKDHKVLPICTVHVVIHFLPGSLNETIANI